MDITIPEDLYESLTLIIKYQNTLLLKEIANEKNWKYTDLKKEFLKDQDMQELVKKYKKKNAKKKKKKEVKNEENIELSVEDTNDAIVLEEPEVVVEQPKVVVEQTKVVVEQPKVLEDKPKKKKKIKK